MKELINKNKINIIILISFLILGGILSLIQQQSCAWDLLRYHFYNAWAFLNNRLEVDLMPCGIQSYLNPIITLPYYFLVKYLNDFPRLVAFIQGMQWGITTFIVYLIAREIIVIKNNAVQAILCAIAALLGSTVSLVYNEIGQGTVNILVNIPVLIAIYFLIKNIYCRKFVLISGILLGSAFAFKLINAIYCISAFLVLFIFYVVDKKNTFKEKFCNLIIFCSSAALMFLLLNGFWMYRLYVNFQNPVFPLFNGIFKSDLYSAIDYRDNKFFCGSLIHYLFAFVTDTFAHCVTDEQWKSRLGYNLASVPYFDLKILFAYIGFVLLSVRSLFFKKFKTDFVNVENLNIFLVLCFLSYSVWVIKFSYMRYFFPIIMCFGIFILIPFILLAERTNKYKLITVIFILLTFISYFTAFVSSDGRVEYRIRVLKIPDLKLKDNSAVVLAGKPLSSYIAIRQNPNVRYIGFDVPADGMNRSLVQTEKYDQRAFEIMNSSSKVYVVKGIVTTDETIERINNGLNDRLKLKWDCRQINSNYANPIGSFNENFYIEICE